MAQTRKLVRDAVRGLLSDPGSGWNAHYEGIRGAYSTESMQIDFGNGSKSFLQARIPPDSDMIDYSQLFPAPIALVLSTGAMTNEKKQNSPFFSGPIECRLDFYLVNRDRNRPGIDEIEWDDTESALDAVEEAALLALDPSSLGWGSVYYNLDFVSERGDLALYGDGRSQRLSILLACEVHV